MRRINWSPTDKESWYLVSTLFCQANKAKGLHPVQLSTSSGKEETRCLSLKTLPEKAGTHQERGRDKLGARVHFQGMRGCGRRAGITEAAL